MNDKRYVSVRCQYCKYPAAIAVLDHADAKRAGFTNSINVHQEHSLNNYGYYYHDAGSCAEALELMMKKHKIVTGKKVRVDNNVLFEHILCFSEGHYLSLESKYGAEKLQQVMLILLKRYCQAIKAEWGFEALGFDCHFFDEGRYEKTGSNEHKFIRNIHCHVQFMNYDFSKKISPLRHLMAKGTNENGQTNQLNPHFERMQQIAFETFERLGFTKGRSKNITNNKHLKKEEFVKQKVAVLEKQAVELARNNAKLTSEFETKKQLFEKVSLEVNTLKEQLNLLHNQIKQIDSLKHEMLEAIGQGSEIALHHLIAEKLVPAVEQMTTANIKYSNLR